MRRCHEAPVLLRLVLLCGVLAHRPVEGQYLDFKELSSSDVSDKFCLCDLDGDGRDEALVWQANHVYLLAWDDDGLKLKAQLPQDRSWHLLEVQAADVMWDDRPEIVVSLLKPDSLTLRIYRTEDIPSSAPSDSIVVPRTTVGGEISASGPYDWDVGVNVLGRLLSSSEDSPVFLAFSTGFSKQPRGLWTFETKAPHRMLWQVPIGPRVMYPVSVFSHPNAESTCIVLPGAYSGQGVYASELTDYVSAVVVVDGAGRILWKKQVGGTKTEPRVVLSDLNSDGIDEVLVACSDDGDEDNSPSRLMSISLFGSLVLKNLKMGTRPVGLASADLDGDGSPEVMLLGANGRLSLLDKGLSETHVVDGASSPWLLKTGDVDYDGHPEIYVSADGGTALNVYDASLGLVGKVNAGGATIRDFAIMSLSRKKNALIVGAHGSVVIYTASSSRQPAWLEHGPAAKTENRGRWLLTPA